MRDVWANLEDVSGAGNRHCYVRLGMRTNTDNHAWPPMLPHRYHCLHDIEVTGCCTEMTSTYRRQHLQGSARVPSDIIRSRSTVSYPNLRTGAGLTSSMSRRAGSSSRPGIRPDIQTSWVIRPAVGFFAAL